MVRKTQMGKMECDFCMRIDGRMPERPWYDFFTLDQCSGFSAVLALGALTPGHIMVVSRRHVECMADLSSEAIDQLNDMVNYWTRIIAEVWLAPCLLFEHGGPSYSCLSGACITHAHLQILPLSADPIRWLGRTRAFSSLPDALAYARGSAYLMYAWGGRFHVAKSHPVPGQFFRRQVAGALGRQEEWDYLAFPNYEYITMGRDRLVGYGHADDERIGDTELRN
jgi:hypothetical protein